MYRVQFMINESANEWSAVPNVRLFSELCRRVPVKERTVATIRKQDSEYKICLGSPNHIETEADYVLWVPEWFFAFLDKKETAVLFSCSSSIPRATMLNFTSESDLPEWLDLKEVLEGVFSQLGVLKRGMVFPIPVLDDTFLTPEISEPYVFLHGDEVEFDVAKRIPIGPPAEILDPKRDIESQTVDFSSMVSHEEYSSMVSAPQPTKNLFPGRGRRLG